MRDIRSLRTAVLRFPIVAAAFTATLLGSPAGADSHGAPAWEWSSTATAPYRAVRVLDTDAMPIEYTRGSRASWGVKRRPQSDRRWTRLAFMVCWIRRTFGSATSFHA